MLGRRNKGTASNSNETLTMKKTMADDSLQKIIKHTLHHPSGHDRQFESVVSQNMFNACNTVDKGY